MLRDDEPDLRRYATTLRRWWFVPIVAGLIAAAVAVVSAPDPAAVRTIRVAAADESGPLAATDVLLLPRDLTFSAEVQRLRSDETDAAVAEAIGFSPDVDVEADSGSQTVRIVSRGVTDEQALAAANGYVDAFSAIRAESMRRSVATALGVVEAQLVQLADRLADVDERLEQVEDPESAVADAIKAERQQVVRDQLDATGRAALLNDFDASVTGAVHVLDVDAATNVGGGSSLLRGLFGFVAGAVIALAGIGIAAFLDKRVRTMYDVEFAIGDGTFLGAVYTDKGRTQGVGVDAVAALTDRFDRVRVMPVGGSVDPDAFASAVRERLLTRREGAGHDDPDGDASRKIVVMENPVDGTEPWTSDDTTSTDGTVLLARIGTCTSDTLVAAAHAVTATGGHMIGALLIGNTIDDTRRIFG